MSAFRTPRLLGAVAIAALSCTALAVPALAQTQLRVAMTAADIPDITGAPDQGYEGYRFAGYTLYDALANWDLSRSDVAADIRDGLATSWEIDPANHERWIFKLREGVKYHDGCAWNADSAVWNFDRVTKPDSPQFNARQAGWAGAAISNVTGVEKVDDLTIAITTKGPDSLLPYELAGFFMISNCAVEAVGNDYVAYAQKPSGTGPYKFESIVPHERLTLAKNPDYWDPKRIPKHDELVLLPMPEASTRAAALLSGQVDFVEAPSPDTIPQLEGAGMQIIKVPYPHNWNYQVRLTEGPFKDLRVRQAANYAINRDEMVEFLQGVATPAYERLIESQPWYGTPTEYKYDPEKAKALLTEAGCMPCHIKVAISTSGSGQMQPLPMNELVKEYLDAVGFETELVPMDWNALLGLYLGGAATSGYDALNVSLAPIDAAQGVIKIGMTRFAPPSGSNWGGYSNPEVDAWGEEALAEFDKTKRDALLTKMNDQASKDAVEVFIVHDLNPRALSPKLSGFVQAQSWFQDMTPIVVNP
jgi:peptide/nickel transport system substrate-binding protein